MDNMERHLNIRNDSICNLIIKACKRKQYNQLTHNTRRMYSNSELTFKSVVVRIYSSIRLST